MSNVVTVKRYNSWIKPLSKYLYQIIVQFEARQVLIKVLKTNSILLELDKSVLPIIVSKWRVECHLKFIIY